MEIRQLRYAVLLAEQRHFGRAAERAFITQSAFSQQIAQLERELGVPPFERKPAVRLTAAGQRFVEHADSILSGLLTLEDDLRSISRGFTGVLRVGTFGAGAGELMPLLVDEFRRSLPQVELEFHDLTMSDQFDQLRSGQVDVTIVHPLCDTDDLDFSVLFDEPRYAAVPIRHEFADAPSLSVMDLEAEPFTTARSGTPVPWRSFWALGEARRSASAVRAEMNSVGEGLAAVAHLGVVDTVPFTATRYHQHPGVAFVPLEDASFSSVAVARRRGDSRPAVETFFELADRLSESHYSLVPGAIRHA